MLQKSPGTGSRFVQLITFALIASLGAIALTLAKNPDPQGGRTTRPRPSAAVPTSHRTSELKTLVVTAGTSRSQATVQITFTGTAFLAEDQTHTITGPGTEEVPQYLYTPHPSPVPDSQWSFRYNPRAGGSITVIVRVGFRNVRYKAIDDVHCGLFHETVSATTRAIVPRSHNIPEGISGSIACTWTIPH